jgi:hypothetical protein
MKAYYLSIKDNDDAGCAIVVAEDDAELEEIRELLHKSWRRKDE